MKPVGRVRGGASMMDQGDGNGLLEPNVSSRIEHRSKDGINSMVYRVMRPTLFDDLPELGMGFHFGQESGRGYIVLNAEYAINPKEICDPVAFQSLAELAIRR